jgi:hypothetical protein
MDYWAGGTAHHRWMARVKVGSQTVLFSMTTHLILKNLEESVNQKSTLEGTVHYD